MQFAHFATEKSIYSYIIIDISSLNISEHDFSDKPSLSNSLAIIVCLLNTESCLKL